MRWCWRPQPDPHVQSEALEKMAEAGAALETAKVQADKKFSLSQRLRELRTENNLAERLEEAFGVERRRP